jgi:glucose/arabinose dehydrogenase
VLGKMLRINSDGSIPTDNPFYGQSGKRGEIWAYGLRNPFRDSFDPATGKLWVADVGQDQWEEIDTLDKGGNYGWRKFEGDSVYDTSDPDPGNTIFPLYEYGHDAGRCAIVGGYVYRGGALSGLTGSYLFADYCTGELWSLPGTTDGTASATLLGTVPGNPTSFGEDAAGEIYVTSYNGHIYKLVPGS